MSSFPPEYEFTYDYDEMGLPVKEYRNNLQYPDGSIIFEYEYIDKYR